MAKQSIIPVILSGGSGTRLWPLSREHYPKQFLPITSEKTLLQETILRASGEGFANPIIVCNINHRFIVAEQLRKINVTPKAILLEPVGRNTAPAAAIAALVAIKENPQSQLLILPADHSIAKPEALQEAIMQGTKAVCQGHLLTFGITPSGPETGYGYIKQGSPLPNHKTCYSVAQFIEKPPQAKAEAYLASGDYAWNSGMFLFAAEDYLKELETHHPEMMQKMHQALENSIHDMDFIRLDEEAFMACPSDSIDYAVMEHTQKAAMIPVDLGWNDVGAWTSLWDIGNKDEKGNVTHGDVVTEDVGQSYLRSEGPLVAALGVDDMVIVATPDAVLVSPKDRVQDTKKIVEKLRKEGREEHKFHIRVYRPWGWYQALDVSERFQVKRIMVKPGEKLSLQMHHHRAEHWVVVSGTAMVTRDEETILLSENESAYIPIGTKHRLENPGKLPLHLIEVQSGTYLGEDDIVRFEDSYGRIMSKTS